MNEQQPPVQREKRPWVKPFIFILCLVGLVILSANVVDYFSFKAAKLDLYHAHEDVEDCNICHQPMQEVRPINCARAKCHTVASFRKTHPETDSLLVQHITRKDCIACHTEHKGRDANLNKPFTHPAQESKCAECHLLPDKHPEMKEEKDCGACHGTKGFKK